MKLAAVGLGLLCVPALASVEATQEVWELPAIVHVQSPAEAWDEEPGLAGAERERADFEGRSTIGESLARSAGTSVLTTGQAGGVTQVRGLGASSDEVSVRALGIPLNPAQGGGFDLSTFPAWYWSEYRFRPGATQAGGESRATSASLDLTPWTASALDEEAEESVRVHALADSQGLLEMASGWRGGKGAPWAAQAGYSQGLAQGPTMGLSGQVFERGPHRARIHALATDRIVQDNGPAGMNPGGFQHTRRVLPVLQYQARLSGGRDLQFSAFYDWGDTVYASPSFGSEMRSQTSQVGVQSALLNRRSGWKTLIGARHAAFMTEGQLPPEETTVVWKIARSVPKKGEAGVEPALGVSSVSALGLMPQAALAYKLPESREREWEFGVEYAQKAPTLVDRFFDWGSFFQGNRGLRPEHSVRARAGLGLKTSDESAGLTVQGYAEQRFESQVLSGTQVLNLGDGRILSLQSKAHWRLAPAITLRGTFSATASKILFLDMEYPFLPALTGRLSQELQPWGEGWPSLELGYEASESVQVLGMAPTRLPGWGAFDLTVTVPAGKGSRFQAGIQNIGGVPYEKVQGYPIGRSVTVAWNATF